MWEDTPLFGCAEQGIAGSKSKEERRKMSDREKQLEAALRAFIELAWYPDSAPGPSYYMVEPVPKAREALVNAGILLDGRSPFPSDNDGTVMEISGKWVVWIGGIAYPDYMRDKVPVDKLPIFDEALLKAKKGLE